MPNVLIGVDGSEHSRTALRWGAVAADALGVPLRAVWSWEFPPDTLFTVGRIDLPDPKRTDRRLTEELRHLLDDVLGERGAGVDAEVRRGAPVDALLRAAREDAMLTVVGTRGLGGFDALRLGSVSRQLVDHARHPVTVVPGTTPVDPPRLATIVVGTDGSDEATRALRTAADLATAAGARLRVVHAAGESAGDRELDRARERLPDWCWPLRADGVEHDAVVVAGDPRTAVLADAREHDADLVVVGSRGRGTVTSLLLGSVATSLVEQSRVPVTVVPPER